MKLMLMLRYGFAVLGGKLGLRKAPLSCGECTDFLGDYFDEELEHDVRRVFEEHLELCPGCVHYLDGYKKTVEMGQAVCGEEADGPMGEVPEELVEAILQARAQQGGD